MNYTRTVIFYFIFMVIMPSSVPLSTSSMKSAVGNHLKLNIYWFRHQDLRLHDNPALSEAIKSSKASGILPIFCFDPRFVGGKTLTPFGSQKCSIRRAKFLLESVMDLRKSLTQRGSGLVIALGKPEHVFSSIIKSLEQHQSVQIFCQQEVASEELTVDKAVEKVLHADSVTKSNLFRIWGSTLYEPKDLPFKGGVQGIPDVFTPFRTQVEKFCKISTPLDTPSNTELSLIQNEAVMKLFDDSIIPNCSLSFVPSLSDLGYTDEEILEAQHSDPRGVMTFEGGESAALRRVQEYIWDKDLLKIYFDTRNGMLGADYSSKMSPWLAHGCLSPRFIAKECKRYEEERLSNKSTYWLIFELLWRDFFKFFALKQGNKIFFLDGTLGEAARGSHPNSRRWHLDKNSLKAWKEGKTGYPLVDANMRELAATGFMSNRGRQNVASFLAIDMNLDWRYGADHFEYLLLDYDVYSNWGNWCSAAGMTGGRLNRFNIVKQSKDYDAQGEYVRHWCPELEKLPTSLVHEPWKMSKEEQQHYGIRLGVDYPNPIVVPTAFNPYKSDEGQGRKTNPVNNGSSYRGKGQRRDMKSLKEGKYEFY